MKVYVPKIICLISSCPVLEFQKQFLAFIYKFTITSKLTKQPPRLQIYQHLFERFTSLLEEEGQFQKAEKRWDDYIYQQTLEYIQTQPQEDEVAKQFKLKEEFLINFSVSMLFRVHTLQNLCIKNTEIIFNLSNEEICRLRPFQQHQNNFFTMNNFSFRPLFEKISIKTTIALLQSMLLERQILLISSNPNEIISICESLFTLIYPLKWACIYIPLLPLQLSEMISAMMPYIIGISKKNFETIKNKIDLKDKVIIDLDSDTVTQVEIHRLPDYLSVYLINNFKELIKKFFASKNEDLKKKNAWFEVIFQLKKIFLNFMTCLINNLTPFFLYSNKFDKDNVAAREIFAKSEYISIFESNEKSFMTELCQNTMMFSKFLEDAYRILYITEFKKEDIDLLTDDKEGLFFFLKNVKKIQKSLPKSNSEKKFDIILNPLIFSSLDYELTSLMDEAMIDYQNPIVIDLTPHLIKYLKFIENKNPEAAPQYPAGSARYITQSKQVFKKLDKEWLMPIPKPVVNVPVQKVSEIAQDHKVGLQNKNQAGLKNRNILEDSSHILNQSSDDLQSLNASIQQNIRSSQQLGQILHSNNNTFIAPKENYKDPYQVSECYQEPPITQSPILFFKNVNMEYDSWHNRQFQQEFDKIKLEYPKKRQMKNQFDIFSAPETRPHVKNIEDMIYMQDILQRMIHESNIKQQNQQQQQQYSKQQYPQSYYQHPSQDNPRINQKQQYQQYSDNHFVSQKYNQPSHVPANPRYKSSNPNNNTTPLYSDKQSNTNQQNFTQLPPLPPNHQDYISNNFTNEDQLSSNRQSKSLAQLKMKNIMQGPLTQAYSTNQLNSYNNVQNTFINQNSNPKQYFNNNNSGGQDNFSQRNMPQISQRSRTNSIDINPLRQNDFNTTQQQPQKYNSRMIPPSLDQKQRNHVDQINIPKAATTTNMNTNKRLSIFQSNPIIGNKQINQQQPIQKQNNLPQESKENLNYFETKENQQPLTQDFSKENQPITQSNNENVNSNNTSTTQVFRERNNHFHHQKNPSWSGSINFQNNQLGQAKNNLRQYSSKQPRSIFN